MPLRVPGPLHDDLKSAAKTMHLSLNQYCLYILARYGTMTSELLTERAEKVLRFFEESNRFQKEVDRAHEKPRIREPAKTVIGRYKELYGKARRQLN